MYEPPGLHFYDAKSRREMKLVHGDAFEGWIAYRHPSGHWVTLREATADDLAQLAEKMARETGHFSLAYDGTTGEWDASFTDSDTENGCCYGDSLTETLRGALLAQAKREKP